MTGAFTFFVRSSRNLCVTTACSPRVKGRNGINSEIRPVIGAYRSYMMSVIKVLEQCNLPASRGTHAKLPEKALLEFTR